MLNETYLKSKRYLVFFSAILALSCFVGLSPGSESNMLGWSMSSPELTSLVLYFVVLYYLGQLLLFWEVQGQDVKQLAQHRYDRIMSILIGVTSAYSLPISHTLSKCGLLTDSQIDDFKPYPTWGIVALALIPIGGALGFFRFFRPGLETSRDDIARREEAIFSVLTRRAWVLVYNPTAFHDSDRSSGHKMMKFSENGEITTGKNLNESSWRTRSGFLEFLNHENSVYNRFSFDRKERRFESTNDDDTLAIRGQYMFEKKGASPITVLPHS